MRLKLAEGLIEDYRSHNPKPVRDCILFTSTYTGELVQWSYRGLIEYIEKSHALEKELHG